jgi:hypothetical protein
MIYTVMDETSYMGMRNQHWLSDEVLDSREILKGIMDKGGEIAVWYEWMDDALGDYHMFVAWRLKMLGAKTWAISIDKKDYADDEAFAVRVSMAMWGYKDRFKEYPNRVIIRKNGDGLSRKEMVYMSENGLEEARLKVVEVVSGWQEGVLGVYYDNGGADGRVEAVGMQ